MRWMLEPEPRPGRLAIVFATAGAFFFGIFGTIFYGLVSVPTSWLTPRGQIWFWLAWHWARQLLFFSGMRLRVVHRARLDPAVRHVFLVNHGSYFDIPTLLATLPVKARFAARHGLFRIPVLGWAMRAGGFIAIDRENRSRARDAFSQAGAELAAGTSILFFPEGTRSHDGHLGPFERGGFLLALRTGMPIVPVGIRGAWSAFPRGRKWVRPGRITITYGEPIEVSGYGVRDRDRLMAEVRAKIAELAGQTDPPEA